MSKRKDFSQIPNVLFDMDLLQEESHLVGFLRLWRLYAHREESFAGSYRKLANLINLPKSCVARMVPDWETAGLVQKTSHGKEGVKREEMILTINVEAIWEFNDAYYAAARKCPKSGRDNIIVPPLDEVVPNRDESGPSWDNNGPDRDEVVPSVSGNSEGIGGNTSNIPEIQEKSDARYHTLLIEQQKMIEDLYSKITMLQGSIQATASTEMGSPGSQQGSPPRLQVLAPNCNTGDEGNYKENQDNSEVQVSNLSEQDQRTHTTLRDEDKPRYLSYAPEKRQVLNNWLASYEYQATINITSKVDECLDRLVPLHPSAELLKKKRIALKKQDDLKPESKRFYKNRNPQIWDVVRDWTAVVVEEDTPQEGASGFQKLTQVQLLRMTPQERKEYNARYRAYLDQQRQQQKAS